MELLTAWTEMGRTVVYVGTETEVALLRFVWAATRRNVPIDTALDPRFLPIFWRSIWYSLVATTACVLLGFPVAYWIARFAGRYRNVFLVLVIVALILIVPQKPASKAH